MIQSFLSKQSRSSSQQTTSFVSKDLSADAKEKTNAANALSFQSPLYRALAWSDAAVVRGAVAGALGHMVKGLPLGLWARTAMPKVKPKAIATSSSPEKTHGKSSVNSRGTISADRGHTSGHIGYRVRG